MNSETNTEADRCWSDDPVLNIIGFVILMYVIHINVDEDSPTWIKVFDSIIMTIFNTVIFVFKTIISNISNLF